MQDLQTIVKGCIQHDKRCQKALYEHYAPKMMAVCSRYAANDAEAADILQEGFIKVFDNIRNLQQVEQVGSWIRGIMVHTALDAIRRKKPHWGHEVMLDTADDPGEDEAVTAQLSADAIMEEIQNLPEGYRAIFNMYAIEGYNHKEIAREMNITPGTSKSQYARAKKLLQARITKLNQVCSKSPKQHG